MCLSASQCGVWWLKHRGHAIVQNSADVFCVEIRFLETSGWWKQKKPFLGEENRENISNILQLLQIPLAKPVFHDHPSWNMSSHGSCCRFASPQKCYQYSTAREIASLEQIHQSIKAPNNHRHLSLRTAKNLSLNLKAHQLVQSCGPSIWVW